MKQCTIFVLVKDYTKILNTIKNIFMDKKTSILEENYRLKVTYKRLLGSYSINFSVMTIDSQPDEFEKMMKEMYNYFYQVQTKQEKIKTKVLQQITYLNACVRITSDNEISDKVYQKIISVADGVSGVLFIPPGVLINREGKVILDSQGHSQLEDFIITASSDLLDNLVKSTKSAENRKRNSIEILKEKNIPFIEHLPVIVGDEEVVIRPQKEIAQRAIALALIATYASELANGGDILETREFVESLIDRYEAAMFFTEGEKSLLNTDTPEQITLIQFSWQYECLWVLLWSLGYIQELNYPDSTCDVQTAISFVQAAETFNDFINKSSLRSKEDVLDQADLIYRYDWACVNARVKKEPVSGGLESGVVVERHKTLNWLTCYLDQEWDDVRTDT